MNSDSSEWIQDLLNAAHGRAKRSLEEAEGLLGSGFPSPALVWAVRSVEIFIKEFVLAPAYLQHTDDDWMKALQKAGKKFGNSNWSGAYKEIERLCGPLDSMTTDTGEDAWTHWEKNAVWLRGSVIHGDFRSGADNATAEEATWAVQYAHQIFTQLTARILVTQKHPVYYALVATLRELDTEDDSGEEG